MQLIDWIVVIGAPLGAGVIATYVLELAESWIRR